MKQLKRCSHTKLALILGMCSLITSCSSDKNPSNKEKSHEQNVIVEVTNNVTAKTQVEPNYEKAANINLKMGYAYLKDNQVVRAKSKFVQAMKLDSNNPRVQSGMAHFYEKVEKIDLAEQHYRKAIEIAEQKSEFYDLYASFLTRQNRFKEAERNFEVALRDGSYINIASVYHHAGLCAAKQGNYLKAEQLLNQSYKNNPQDLTPLISLAEIAVEKADYPKALDLIKKCKNLVFTSPKSLLLALKVAEKTQDDDLLVNSELTLKNLFPKSPEYSYYLKLKNDKPS